MKSIRWKLIVIFGTLIFIVAVSVGAIGVFQANSTVESVVNAKFSSTLKSSTNMLELYLSEQFGTLSLDGDTLVDSDGQTIEGRPEYLSSFSNDMNMLATVFVRRGDDYIRILTTVTDNHGNLALETELDSEGIAYEHISQGQSYYGPAQILGLSYFTAYQPLYDQGGEIIGIYFVGIPLDEVESIIAQGNSETIFFMAVAVIVLLVVALLSIFFISGSIVKPIKHITWVAKDISNGIFHTITDVGTEDEVGQLSDAFGITVNNLQQYIDEIGRSLKSISSGDLRVDLQCNYVGDFEKLESSINDLTENLQKTLSNIELSSGRLRESSVQISQSAQTLAGGSIEQASSIQELSATMDDISKQLAVTAKHFETVKEHSQLARKNADDSNHRMQDMTTAMHHINKKSGEIQNIVRTIDDIAFQTNILALNAAVEAARAGQAGKGFAVVADEVRTFAARSAEAAQMTATLIEETGKAVSDGTAILSSTADSLSAVVDSINNIGELVDEIGTSASLQVQAVDQVNVGISQISEVVNSNSATAQHSAAASEELSSLSDELHSQISEFKFKDKA